MERLVGEYSYWVGLVCVAIAVIMRGLDALGMSGVAAWYMTFFKGGALLLLVTMATASYTRLKSQRP
jgi:hypothetical protein